MCEFDAMLWPASFLFGLEFATTSRRRELIFVRIFSNFRTNIHHFLTGFHGVTKLEFKRDTRDIDKRSTLMNMNETDSEDEIEGSVPVTMRPPCNTDSTAYKKMNRFKAWVSDPSLVSGCMTANPTYSIPTRKS